jgi:hypothetical protein
MFADPMIATCPGTRCNAPAALHAHRVRRIMSDVLVARGSGGSRGPRLVVNDHRL